MNEEVFYKSGMLNDVVEQISNFDVFDVISRLAGMNLINQNQNKSVYFDTLIEELLGKPISFYDSKNIMSAGRFSRILKQLSGSSLQMSIDPNENVFVQSVSFGKSYRVFNGIDVSPAYNMQIMERILFEVENKYPAEYIEKMRKTFNFVLSVSETVADKCGVSTFNSINDEEQAIVIPDASVIKSNAQLVTIDGEYFDGFFGEMDTSQMFASFSCPVHDGLSQNQIYVHPLLRNHEDNSIILLNLAVLPTFTVFFAIQTAKEYAVYEDVVNQFNDYIFEECKGYLRCLGHPEIDAHEYEIELINESFLKEQVLFAYNNQLLILFFCCDDGADFEWDALHSPYPALGRINSVLEERIKYYVAVMSRQGIASEDVYVALVSQSFGRSMVIGIGDNMSAYEAIKLQPFELLCVSINEKERYGFIPKYLRAKKTITTMQTMISELNQISFYAGNSYSFYCSDKYDFSGLFTVFGMGDSFSYVKDALLKENRKSVPSYKGANYTEVIGDENIPGVFYNVKSLGENSYAVLVNCSNTMVWFYGDESGNTNLFSLAITIINALAYWFAAVMDMMANSELLFSNKYVFRVLFHGELDNCIIEGDEQFEELIEICKEKEEYKVDIDTKIWRLFYCDGNNPEKELVRTFLKVVMTKPGNSDLNEHLDVLFANPLRKRIIVIDTQANPCLQEPIFKLSRIVEKASEIATEDTDFLLGAVGRKVVETGEWNYGVVDSTKRDTVAKLVVQYLFEILQERISRLSPNMLVELVYSFLESILFRLIYLGERYKFDIACFPEKEKDYLQRYNELNRSSLAYKFLLEYIAAKPPRGSKEVGLGEIQYVAAVCSLIIEWGYKNDLFYYDILNTPVEILKSNRIGLRHEDFDVMTASIERFRKEQLSLSKELVLNSNSGAGGEIIDKLNKAFLDEREYTYTQFVDVISALCYYTEEGEVFVYREKDVVKSIGERVGYPARIIEKVINDVALQEREDYLSPPSPFRKEDVYPWRFNRTYSFIRRPLIRRGEELIWGTRQVYNMLTYTNHLLCTERYKTNCSSTKQVMSEFVTQHGDRFNRFIADKLIGLGEFDVYCKVKKINGKKIASEDGNDLGDIDVLLIDHKKLKIYACEIKAFSFARNPYEMQSEYRALFVDEGKKKCFVSKHKRRVEWLERHIEDVIAQYKLATYKWAFQGVFITKDPIISLLFKPQDMKFLTESAITIETIRKL